MKLDRPSLFQILPFLAWIVLKPKVSKAVYDNDPKQWINANPVDVIEYLLKSKKYEFAVSSEEIDQVSFKKSHKYCADNDLFISIFPDGCKALTLLNRICRHIGCCLYWSGSKVRIEKANPNKIEWTIDES